MKLNVRHRRRNKRAKAVRRLQGMVNARDVTIKALQAQVEGLGGDVKSLDTELERKLSTLDVVNAAKDAASRMYQSRIRQLERVPRIIRWLFRAG